jgi:NAD+--dinitrogen-reductase ADP-D-ribosyltransferase
MTDDGWRGHSTNLVGIPTGLLASSVFNDYPLPLRIAGARETNPALFEMLTQAADAIEAAEAFEKYLSAAFGIDAEGTGARNSRHRFRSSYRQLLEGWGFDANGPAGAVLKGWVESRFGLLPVFHKAPIRRVGSTTWIAYVEEKMSSRHHNNSINLQLDLLYEFCQWSLTHFFRPGRHVTLYRGVNDFAEHEILRCPDRHAAVVRMNSLVSFSAERAVADAFGDIILEARVPTTKILFFRELLPVHPLSGEAEYLVIGGDYQVKLNYL